MSRLPRGLSYRRVVAALKRAGFSVKSQKGSHIVMRRDEPFAQVVVPAHRSLDTGTPYTLDFAGADGGKNAHYLLRWVNPTGEKGPWSETATVTVGA